MSPIDAKLFWEVGGRTFPPCLLNLSAVNLPGRTYLFFFQIISLSALVTKLSAYGTHCFNDLTLILQNRLAIMAEFTYGGSEEENAELKKLETELVCAN